MDTGIYFLRRNIDPKLFREKAELWSIEARSAEQSGELTRALYALPRAGECLLKAYIAGKGILPPSGSELDSALSLLLPHLPDNESKSLCRAKAAYSELFNVRWRGLYEPEPAVTQWLKKAGKCLTTIELFLEKFCPQGKKEANYER
jgi:hypothetical protein